MFFLLADILQSRNCVSCLFLMTQEHQRLRFSSASCIMDSENQTHHSMLTLPSSTLWVHSYTYSVFINQLSLLELLQDRVPTLPRKSWNFFLTFQDLESLGTWVLSLKILEFTCGLNEPNMHSAELGCCLLKQSDNEFWNKCAKYSC